MRAPHKVAEWAQKTQNKGLSLRSLIWNVWLMLALPAIWLIWSLLFYITCIMVLIWSVKIRGSPAEFNRPVAYAARVVISLILTAGFAYLVMAVREFIELSKDSKFKEYFDKWVARKSSSSLHTNGPASNLNLDHGRQDMTTVSTGMPQCGHAQEASPNDRPLPDTPNANAVENPSEVAKRQDLTEEDLSRE
ncbi:hypothetical protein H1R20_g2834, partial [Candolleomyces eurysporus]